MKKLSLVLIALLVISGILTVDAFARQSHRGTTRNSSQITANNSGNGQQQPPVCNDPCGCGGAKVACKR